MTVNVSTFYFSNDLVFWLKKAMLQKFLMFNFTMCMLFYSIDYLYLVFLFLENDNDKTLSPVSFSEALR